MSTDVAGIVTALPFVHDAWAGLVELSVGMYLISTVIKQSAFLVILPAVSKYKFLALW